MGDNSKNCQIGEFKNGLPKVGDKVKIATINSWSDHFSSNCPIGIVAKDDIGVIQEIGEPKEGCGHKYIPFSATFNGVKYGFCFSYKNHYSFPVECKKSKLYPNKVDRNSKDEIQKDMDFISSMKEHIDTNNMDYVRQMIDDWYFELKRRKDETT